MFNTEQVEHMLDRAVRVVVAFDPGWKNFAVWKGAKTSSNVVESFNWNKFDVTNKNKKPGGVYTQIADTLEANSWIWHDEHADPRVYPNAFRAVIETQEPHNVPARIVASTIYGFLRAKGVPVKFSGAHSKSQAKELISRDLCLGFDQTQCTGTANSSQAYRTTKKTSYEVACAWAEHYGSISDKDLLRRYCAKKGEFKGDDLAEAFLLGYAELCVPDGKKTSRCKIVYDKTDDLAGDGEDNEDDKDGYGNREAPTLPPPPPKRKRAYTPRKKKSATATNVGGGEGKGEKPPSSASSTSPPRKRRRKSESTSAADKKQQQQQATLNFRQGMMLEQKKKGDDAEDDTPFATEQQAMLTKMSKLLQPKPRVGLDAILGPL